LPRVKRQDGQRSPLAGYSGGGRYLGSPQGQNGLRGLLEP